MAAGAKKASGNEANSVPQVVGYKRNNTTYRSDVTTRQGCLLYPVALLLFDWFLYFSHPLGVKWVGNMFARKKLLASSRRASFLSQIIFIAECLMLKCTEMIIYCLDSMYSALLGRATFIFTIKLFTH